AAHTFGDLSALRREDEQDLSTVGRVSLTLYEPVAGERVHDAGQRRDVNPAAPGDLGVSARPAAERHQHVHPGGGDAVLLAEQGVPPAVEHVSGDGHELGKGRLAQLVNHRPVERHAASVANLFGPINYGPIYFGAKIYALGFWQC